jgi:hypothetical protein
MGVLVGKIDGSTAHHGPIHLTLTLMLVSFTVALGCEVPGSIRRYPLSKGTVTVNGDKIYEDGKLFAELRYFTMGYKKETPMGFGIYYVPYDKEIWICPREGWRLEWRGREYKTVHEVEKVWNESGGEAAHYVGDKDVPEKFPTVPRHIRISKDGRYVY